MPCRCCTNSLLVGCVSNCAKLIINTGSTLAGDVFTLFVDFANTEQALQYVIPADGDKPIFELNSLNENYTFIGQVYRNDTAVKFSDSATNEYDCIKFSTRFSNALVDLQTIPLVIL